jgi:hypothetical protein
MGRDERLNAAAREQMMEAQKEAERRRYDATVTRVIPEVVDDKGHDKYGELINHKQTIEVPGVKMPGVNQAGYWVFEGDKKILLIPAQQIVDVELTQIASVDPPPKPLVEVPRLV